ARESGNPDDVRSLLLRAAGLCLHCGQPTDLCHDEPGYRYLYCSWCREHRAETHCYHCQKPLATGENGWCTECYGGEEPISDKAMLPQGPRDGTGEKEGTGRPAINLEDGAVFCSAND